MKIAILAPISWRTPPRKYGPWEQVASNLAEGLVEKGIDVTLFATGDSITKGNLEFVSEMGYSENLTLDPKVEECLHISHLMEQAYRFDLIHNHFDFLPLSYSRLILTPMLTTIHGFSSSKILSVYRKYNATSHYVSISDSDRNPELDYAATVYNGLNTDEFTFNPEPKPYLLFFGRIHPEKGTHSAIKIAKQSSKKLIISGLIQDQEYFDQQIKPFLNAEDVVYVGNSGPRERDKLLGEAFALLHPIEFEEPFGLSVAESMCCGTPVIAFNMGSMPELIQDGKTGFLVNSVAEAVEAVGKVKYLNRTYCREYATTKFSLQKMTAAYLAVYREILGNTK